jgi:signal transduction histidine kinase
METLLDRTRDHVRGELGGAPGRCDVNAAVAAAAATLAPRLGERGLTLERDLTENLPAAAAPAVVVQSILVNLIGNACDALHDDGGVIRVRTWSENGVIAQVEDDGPGIPDDRDAFLPFVSGKAHGTGLGLWLSRTLAERAGGSLEAMPATPGAAFRLTLPEADPTNRSTVW